MPARAVQRSTTAALQGPHWESVIRGSARGVVRFCAKDWATRSERIWRRAPWEGEDYLTSRHS